MKKPKKPKSKILKDANKMMPGRYDSSSIAPFDNKKRTTHISVFIWMCAIALAFWLGTVVGR